MQYQPIDYSSGAINALQSGVNMGLGLREANMRQQLFDQQAAEQEKQQQFGVELKSAWESGDNRAMVDLIASNPEQLQTIQGLMGFRDQQQRQAIGDVASQLTAALDSGNVQGAAGVIQANAEPLKAMGQDPAILLQQLHQDPTALRKGADSLMLLTMSPDQVMAYKQKLEDQKIARERIAETARGHTITQQGQQAVPSRAASGGRKESDAGLAWTQLADGRMVQVEKGKPYGAGASQFFKGYDEDGNLIRVPVSSMAAPPTSGESARQGLTSADASILMNASDKEIGAITGITGSIGSPALTADIASRLGPELRPVFSAAKRINSAMQNQGIGAARDMGASGINTVAEAKMYFASMPQLDYSSPQAFRDSLGTIDQYTKTFNTKNSAKLGGGEGKSGAKAPSYTTPPPQAAIDFLRENPQFKGAFKQKYGALPEGM